MRSFCHGGALPDCTLKIAKAETGICLRIEGWGTMKQSRLAKEVATAALRAADDSRVVFDLSLCTYLDSTFLGCLMDMYRSYGRSNPPRFLIAAPVEVRTNLLKSFRLDRILPAIDVPPNRDADFVEIPGRVFGTQDLIAHVMECHQHLAESDSVNREIFLKIADQLRKELQDDPKRI